jgi:tRNA pseudouridine32 synthase/23S rRNA pseudouridine746 synthase
MTKGAVWHSRGRRTRRLRRHTAPLHPGDWLHLYFDPAVLTQTAPKPTLIADEGEYSVWHKPYGLRSQGSKWGDHTTLARWAELHLEPERPAFIIHRLDRAASGLMMLAHGKGTARRLAALFQNREIEKHYHAIVHGRLPGDGPPLTVDRPIDGKRALSHIRSLGVSADRKLSLLEIRIETGRKHQIRRHLAGLGLPILGDRLYGRDGDSEDLALAAVSLRFSCPITGAARRYELPPPLRPSLGD